MKRFLALLLSLCMMWAAVPVSAEEETTPSDLTDPPAVTESPAPSEEPAATETPAASGEPEVTETPAASGEPEVTETPAASQEPEVTETPAASQEPEVTETPAASQEPAVTPVPWDETVCDHANPSCLQAPACDLPGCTHIIRDVLGLDCPLCSLGVWLLDRQDALSRTQGGESAGNPGTAHYSSRFYRVPLTDTDINLWRSGACTVEWSSVTDLSQPSLWIAEDRIVTLRLQDVALDSLRVERGAKVTVDLSGVSGIAQMHLAGGSAVTFRQGGSAVIGVVLAAPDASIRILGGSLRAECTEAEGRQPWTFPVRGDVSVSVEGASYGLTSVSRESAVTLWLNPPAPGMVWRGTQEEGILLVRQEAEGAPTATPGETAAPTPGPTAAPTDEATVSPSAAPSEGTPTPAPTPQTDFVLTREAPFADAGSAERFTVRSSGGYLNGAVSAAGCASASAVFQDVQLQGSGAVLSLANEQLTLTLRGDNGLVSTGEAISLDAASSLFLRVESGRLLLRSQSSLSGIYLSGNVKVEPDNGLSHPVLQIRDQNGNVVPNRPITLHIGARAMSVITHFDGTVHLWGQDTPDPSALSAEDEVRRYTVSLLNGEEEQGLTIGNVQVKDTEEGDLLITWTCGRAASEGVQYIAAPQNRDIPAGYFDQAVQVAGAEHRATLTDLKPGETVSFRVYASATASALTGETGDSYVFSAVQHHLHREPFPTRQKLDVAYTGKAFRNPLTLTSDIRVTYRGNNLNEQGKPVEVGRYTMVLTVPEYNPYWLPGVYELPFEIKEKGLIIRPDPNQEKYELEEDPEFTFTVEGLLPGEEVTGTLTREEGEEPGNYAFLIGGLSAPDHYAIMLPEDAPVFTILPAMPVDPGFVGEVLIPITQELTRRDGRKVTLQLKTDEELYLGSYFFGYPLLDTDRGETQLFSPSMSWNEENDTVLLRLRCLPRMNADRGYATNPDGSLQWAARELRFSWRALRNMQQAGVDALTLSDGNAQLTLPLGEVVSEEIQAWVRQETFDMNGAEFRLRIEPLTDEPIQDMRPVTDGWRFSVTLVMNGKSWDFISELNSRRAGVPGREAITVAVDMEPVAALLQSVSLYDEETFPDRFTLADSQNGAQDCVFVTPFLPEETGKAVYRALVYTHRYLLTAPRGAVALWCREAD